MVVGAKVVGNSVGREVGSGVVGAEVVGNGAAEVGATVAVSRVSPVDDVTAGDGFGSDFSTNANTTTKMITTITTTATSNQRLILDGGTGSSRLGDSAGAGYGLSGSTGMPSTTLSFTTCASIVGGEATPVSSDSISHPDSTRCVEEAKAPDRVVEDDIIVGRESSPCCGICASATILPPPTVGSDTGNYSAKSPFFFFS
jgi:hypothetical protein